MPVTSAEGYGLLIRRPASQAGQTTAAEVGTLVETYSALLYRVANSILRSPSDAEDVVQEVFVRVLEHRAKLPQVRDLRVWLVRIAWNLALDRRRRIRPDQMDALFAESLVASGKPADEAVDDAHRLYQVLAEIERLPKAERHALLLASVEDFEISEIAALVGRSESATRALLFRARARLRQRMEKGDTP